ncbi:hypothetical protein BD410DRAFT_361709 [Rickenella mellea]|uniref:Uncharacterized protein n=1 Tax=Rickenella mellea TaxID=50990 RepID=A0A4Y7PYZ6_9AGAM|nr:hypothetical protein BD410DRAFT_361709 [Rickenella mellea]
MLNEELPVDAEDRVISIAMTIPKFGDIEATSTAALERIGKRIDPSCITVKLQSPDKFQESDVRLNDINIVAEIDDQEHFISKLRSELRKARHVHSDRARPYFLSVMRDYFKDHNLFRNTFKETKVASTTNSTKTELNAFVALCSLMDCIDGIIKKSLAMKDSVFSRLIMPALFEMEMNTKPTKFDKTVRWSCPLLVEIQGERFRRRYKPNNNFSLAHPNFSPYIIGEVATDESESNRYRMLIQGAAAVRLGNAMRASKSEEQPFILQAIYLTNDFVAERYLMYQDDVKSPGPSSARCV